MSNLVLPTPPGLAYGTKRVPLWATKVLTASSGRELRGQLQSYPRYRYILSYEVLRSGGRWGLTELEEMLGFFNRVGGSADTFLFRDEDDYLVSDEALGTSDGVTDEYRLVRVYGGFVEPVLAPDDAWLYLDRGAALGKWYVTDAPRTNMFWFTESIDSSYWAKNATTVTANATTAPDGVSDADKLVEDTANTQHYLERTAGITPDPGKRYCLSWHVKAAGRTSVYLKSFWDGVVAGAEFTLSGAGTVLSQDAGLIGAGIRALSNGWYRVWIVFSPTSVTPHQLRLNLKSTAGGSVSYTGDGSSGVYATWAQMEEIGDTAPLEPTEYIPSVGGASTTVQAAFTMSDHGYFTLSTVPPSGVDLSWSGNFYWRSRFVQDSTEFEKFARQLFANRKIELITTK